MLLDVTLRDGGFVNGFRAALAEMSGYVTRMATELVDIIELGYCGGLPVDHGDFPAAGPSLDLHPNILRQLVQCSRSACAVMVHPAHPHPVAMQAIRDAGVSLVRIPVRPGEGRAPWLLASSARDVGLRVSINLILMSWWTESTLAASAALARDSGATILYLADTNSAMVPQQVGGLVSLIRQSSRDLPVGFHAHDGLGLALSNANAAVAAGAEWVDTAMGGVGRGAGNLALEVLLVSRGLRQEACAALQELPTVQSIFGRPSDHELWERLCAFLDISPACSATLIRIAEECGRTRVAAAIDLLSTNGLSRPFVEDLLRAELRRSPR